MLLLINGAPGVGKSTLAERFADEHPLTLIIDIDALRTQLGQWAAREESKLVAHDLAVALARSHLQGGHAVIVPQYLGRPEFREQLRSIAVNADVAFVEVLLTDDAERITERFRARRSTYATAGTKHPEGDLADDAVATEIARANELLLADAAVRAIPVVSAAAGLEEAYRLLREAVTAATRRT